MPDTVPKSCPSTIAGTLLLPTAVLAVCEPWPSPSRVEMTSTGSRSTGLMLSRKASGEYRALTTLLLQLLATHFSPGWQKPRNRPPSALRIKMSLPRRYMSNGPVGLRSSLVPRKEPDSGQMPVSRSPTTTRAPAFGIPPFLAQAPFAPASPRNFGVFHVSVLKALSLTSISTSRSLERSAAWAAVRWAVKELLASLDLLIPSAPTRPASRFCPRSRYAE